jgi:hypothetical protein
MAKNQGSSKREIVIFNDKRGVAELEVHLKEETVWLNQAQMAQLFDKDVRTVSEHINNVYKESELHRGPTIRKFRIVQTEGKRLKEPLYLFHPAARENKGYEVAQHS